MKFYTFILKQSGGVCFKDKHVSAASKAAGGAGSARANPIRHGGDAAQSCARKIREDRSPTAINEENVATLRQLIKENWRTIYEEIRRYQRISCYQRRQQTNKIKAGEKRKQKNDYGFFFSKADPVCPVETDPVRNTIALEEKNTVNAVWYATICLPSVLEKVREKQPRSHILLRQDNALSCTANKTMSFLLLKR
ncbi:hypothetical protein EVAR_17487_1 [Eumeta japonica]|uniref:Uncharacterized protein n=1 Tax=Eumeta variegata TaxID=151549 RepID=A0A4C1ZIU8_EUMVA|nr:hypothetical protein EVAR_17487_1 [Eumeta japonica]